MKDSVNTLNSFAFILSKNKFTVICVIFFRKKKKSINQIKKQ